MPDTLGFSPYLHWQDAIKSINMDLCLLNSEITFEQMGLLYYISRNSERNIIQQEIADLMNKTKSAVLRSLDITGRKKIFEKRRNAQ